MGDWSSDVCSSDLTPKLNWNSPGGEAIAEYISYVFCTLVVLCTTSVKLRALGAFVRCVVQRRKLEVVVAGR